MALAYDRDPDVLDPVASKTDTGTAARMAAEKTRAKFQDIGANTAQAAALVEAIRLILVEETDRAEDALQKAEFTSDEIDLILPHLLSGLHRAA